jgi:putative transposase
VIEIMVKEHRLPVRRACHAAGLSRTAWYRRPVDPAERDREVVDALLALVERHGRWGFWKCYRRLRLDGYRWNHKRVHRVYCALGLNLPRRTKKRIPQRIRIPLVAPRELNGIWAIDFMRDTLYGGRVFRTLNILDEANREGLAIEVGTSIPAARLVRVLDQLVEIYGKPAAIRCDNGPELIAQVFLDWCKDNGVEPRHIQPGKPDQNAFIERFNRSYRQEVLDAHLFETIEDVQALSDEWLQIYNEERPHDALGNVPPVHYLPRPRKVEKSTYRVCA